MFICGYCHQPLVEQRPQIVSGLLGVAVADRKDRA